MAEAQLPEAPTKRKSVLPKLLLLALAMVVVAVAVNFKDLRAIAAGERTVKSVLYGKTFLPKETAFAFPPPIGPEKAKVKALVVCQEGNSCHEPLVLLWMAVGKLEPERVRVEFVNYGGGPTAPPPMGGKGPKGSEPEAAADGAAEAAPPGGVPDLGCSSGATVNGESKFELGKGKDKRVLYLTGPMPAPPGGMAGQASGADPRGHGWSVKDVAEIVNQAIEKAYKSPGKLTGEALTDAMNEASKEIPRPEASKDGGPKPPH
jgi:hypothetical protein